MSTFKDVLKDDLNVFFNIDELGAEHNINSNTQTIVIDNELLKDRQAKNAEGTYRGDLLFFIKKEDFGEAPAIAQTIKFDGEIMRVSDFNENEGVYEITLEANMS